MNELYNALLMGLGTALINETEQLRDGKQTIDEWQLAFLAILARYYNAALMLGADSFELTKQQVDFVTSSVQEQDGYLANFGKDIEKGWDDKFLARSEMYASSMTPVYWKGATWDLKLPAQPGEGSECLVFCKCMWDIVWVDRTKGDANCYWALGESEHCPTCILRANEWSPILVRNGKHDAKAINMVGS